MSLITVEVEIDHGSLTTKDSHLLPERGVGLLTIVRSEDAPREKSPALICRWCIACREPL